MNYKFTSILIILLLLFVLIVPAKGALKTTYLVVPADTIVKLEDIKTIWTNQYWFCLDCIKDLIDLSHMEDGYNLANEKYKEYLDTNKAEKVFSGYVPVMFLMEYNGFWIFTINR